MIADPHRRRRAGTQGRPPWARARERGGADLDGDFVVQ
jgi:hypothetical protein